MILATDSYIFNKSFIPTFGIYIHTLANEPKVGIKLLLISYLLPHACMLLQGSYILLVFLLCVAV